MKGSRIINLEDRYLLEVYRKFHIVFVKGKGAYLYDIDGKKYLDFSSGIGVMNFGHSRAEIVKAICSQAKKLLHVSNLFYTENRWEVAQKISDLSFPGKTFFANSGAEAVEGALKFARIWGNKKNPEKNIVLSLEGSFHGRTYGAITLTGQEKYKKYLHPLLPNIVHVKFNDVGDLRRKIEEYKDRIAGIFLEAVQGEGGVNPLKEEFVEEVKNLAQKYDFLIIFDEVQTGIGRTGRYFGYQWYDVVPDIITMAKAVGGGIPMGAIHVNERVAEAIEPGMHASTMGGNPLALSASLQALKLLTPDLMKHVNNISTILIGELKNIATKYQFIKDVRGKGLMIGIEFDESVKVIDIINNLLYNERVITLSAGNNVLRLLPPLIIEEREVKRFLRALNKTLKVIK